MTLAPLRPCIVPGCMTLHRERSSFCPAHQRPRWRKDAHTASTTARGYGARWRHVRDAKLKADPLCERCTARRMVVPASVVHHRDHDQQHNAPANLESLCRACHEAEHGRAGEGGGQILGAFGPVTGRGAIFSRVRN